MKTFNGTVAASTIQPGAGAEKIRKPMGNAKMRSTSHPARSRTPPASTGLSDATSKNQMSWLRDKISTHNPPSSDIHPHTGEGDILAFLSFSRDCHTSHSEATIMSGPCPSCSVCQGPCARVMKVGRYATTKAPSSVSGQSHPRTVNCLELIKASEKLIRPISKNDKTYHPAKSAATPGLVRIVAKNQSHVARSGEDQDQRKSRIAGVT